MHWVKIPKKQNDEKCTISPFLVYILCIWSFFPERCAFRTHVFFYQKYLHYTLIDDKL